MVLNDLCLSSMCLADSYIIVCREHELLSQDKENCTSDSLFVHVWMLCGNKVASLFWLVKYRVTIYST